MAVWGAGEYHYLGEPGSSVLDWNGNMVSAHVGVDARVGSDILAGVAASYSAGDFDFTDKTGATPVTGPYATTMTSANPYVAWFSGDRGNALWGTAGVGWGDIEVDDPREGLRTSPARTITGGAGGSYQLLTSGVGGIRLKAEGWTGQVMVDGGEQIDSVTLATQIDPVTLNMQRGKLALELTQGYRSSGGGRARHRVRGRDALRQRGRRERHQRRSRRRAPVLERRHGPDDGRPRQAPHLRRDGYEEWGIGGMIQVDPGARSQGLQIRLAPSYGDAASGVNQLWERGGFECGPRPRLRRRHQPGRRGRLRCRRLPGDALHRLLPRRERGEGLQQRAALQRRFGDRPAHRGHAA